MRYDLGSVTVRVSKGYYYGYVEVSIGADKQGRASIYRHICGRHPCAVFVHLAASGLDRGHPDAVVCVFLP